jgi:hypothetical protein
MRHRRAAVAAVVAATLLTLLLACAAGGLSLRAGLFDPPEVELTIGGVGVVARTTTVPSCAITLLPCAVRPLADGERMYAVWAVWRPRRTPADPIGARRLFAMRIPERP